jgi:RHS repeat-associated protein
MATKTWTGGGTTSRPKSANWGTSADWSPAGVPGTGDDVIIDGSGSYAVTLNINTANLNSLTINNSGATLAIGSFTLNVTGTAASAINLLAGKLTISGGTINDAGGMALASSTSLSGHGTLNISGHYTGAGTLLASGGTLDVFGTIDSGVGLQIASGTASTLKIEGTAAAAAAISISSANQTLEIGTAGNLTINAVESITKGKIQLDGGTLTDASGIAVGNGALLTGKGSVAAPLSGSGTIKASGGTLDLTKTVSSGLSLQIDTTAGSDLKVDGTATAASAIAMINANQTLEIGIGGALTIKAAESISNAKIQLDGGSLTDVSGLTLGTGAQGSSTADLDHSFTVTNGPAGNFAANISIAGPLVPGQPNVAQIQYSNSGETDITAPLITLSAEQISSNSPERAPIELVIDGSGNSKPATSVSSLAVNPTGPAGILQPGAQGTISVDFTPYNIDGNIQFSLGSSSFAPATLLDVSSLEQTLRPPTIDVADWNNIWNRFVAQVGTTVGSTILGLVQVPVIGITAGSLDAALAQAATTLSQIGQPTSVVNTLLNYELQQASGLLPNIFLVKTADLAPVGTGLNLSFTRTYSTSLLNRDNPGPFGNGWTFSYGISAITDASGNVYITSPSGTEVFTPQPDGTYAAQPGDSSVLTMSGGTYVLTSTDGTVERFLSSGQIGSITDSNGNTVTVSYDSDGIISGITSSLTFTTNSQGRITSVSDGAGQQVTYTYDASGDHLLSVSGPGGVTSYSYDASGNPLSLNALTRITYPDGTSANFQYDSQGNLSSQSGSNGTGEISYSYGAGTVIETDTAGNAITLIYDSNGNLAETKDALGNVTKYQHNSAGELTNIVTPTGATVAYRYDSEGNLIGYTDSNGRPISATYAPGTNLPTSFTDQNGNTTKYSYSAAGDLTGIICEDGSGATYQYSPNGLLTSTTDARGQTTTYAYNAQGLLTLETFSDATFQAYGYNAKGELVSAQATDGSITSYGYNAADELTSVTNPAGQVESYTYNSAGQVLTRTEPNGSVTRYSYNAAGQLAELKDGAGNLITQYSYNTLGQLAGSRDGNGQSTNYQYDGNGNLTQILIKAADETIISELNYSYDADGRPVTVTSLDGIWTYTYDAAGQLTHAVFVSTNASIANQDLTYEYDATGNRSATIFNGAVNNYTTNGLNQYTATDGTAYSYDADGNLVSKSQNGATTTYTYNSLNQLTAVTGPNGTYTYRYDALGNMVSSTANGVISKYIIDPLAISSSATGPLSAIAQVYNAAGNVTATYDYGLGLAAVTDAAGDTSYFNTDLTGNVTGISGQNGSLTDSYFYLPFGETVQTGGSSGNPFQYGGGLGITTNGSGLNFMRARFYDPVLGRFDSRDPINLVGGTNLYAYVNNGTTYLLDPSGLEATSITQGIPLTATDLREEQRILSEGLARAQAVIDSAEEWRTLNAPDKVLTQPQPNWFPWDKLPGALAELSSKSAEEASINILEEELGLISLPVGLGITAISLAIDALDIWSKEDPASFDEASYTIWQAATNALQPFQKTLAVLALPIQKVLGGGSGDTHLTTFSGLHYDFQGAGEFTFAKSTDPNDGLNVQVRLAPWESFNSNVTVITGLAAQVGSHRVTAAFDVERPSFLTVDGAPVTLGAVGSTLNLGAGRVQYTGGGYQIIYNSGEIVSILNPFGGGFFNATVQLASGAAHGSVEGLLGTYSGNLANDLAYPNGTVLQQPIAATELYTTYADLWRVTPANSLFDYGPGETTDTFTIEDFPKNVFTPAQLPSSAVDQARAYVIQAGITDPLLQQDAILDFIATGNPIFITAAQNLQQQGFSTGTAAQVLLPAQLPAVVVTATQTSAIESSTGPTVVTFQVSRTGDTTNAVDLGYAVSPQASGYVGPSDFGGVLPSGIVTIPAGQSSAQFSIAVPTIGTHAEEMLQVAISGPSTVAVFGKTAQTSIVNYAPVAGPPAVPLFESGVGTVQQNGASWTLDLGNITQGSAFPSFGLVVQNAATEPADNLSGLLAAAGDGYAVNLINPVSPLSPGQTGYIATSVTVDTSSPGTHTETITFSPIDSNLTGYSAALPTQTLTITDTVYALAVPAILTAQPIDFGIVRGGPSSDRALSIGNSVAAPLQETLDVSVGGAIDGATASGSISRLGARQTDSTDILIGVDPNFGGPLNGQVILNFESDGTGVDGNGATPLLSQSVAVTGTAYRDAVASIRPVIAHVGDPETETLRVLNLAPNDGYSEKLAGTLVGSSGSVTASGTFGPELSAGHSSTGITLNFSTAALGTAGTVTLDFQSDGTGVDGFSPIEIGQQTVPVVVENFASAAFETISGGGSLTQNGNAYTLDLGTITQSTAPLTLKLGVLNTATGPADVLGGNFSIGGDSAFTNSGFGAFNGVAVSQADTAPTVKLDVSATGTVSEPQDADLFRQQLPRHAHRQRRHAHRSHRVLGELLLGFVPDLERRQGRHERDRSAAVRFHLRRNGLRRTPKLGRP